MDTLPQFIKFIIFNCFSHTELARLRYVSKSWHAVISSERFWAYKMCLLTGQAVSNKTQLPGKLWYDRHTQSGQLYRVLPKSNVNCPLEYEFTGLDNIYSYRQCGHCHYYLTLDGALYYEEKVCENYEVPLYGFRYNWKKNMTHHYKWDRNVEYRGCGSWCPEHQKRIHGLGNLLVDKNKSALNLVDQISNVKDIIPTYIGDFILTFDSKLYMIGTMAHSNKLTCHADNVKSIHGCSILFCYLTWDDKLWVYLGDKFLLQANNVISANILFVGDEIYYMWARLYYLKADGKLWSRCDLDIDEIPTGDYHFKQILPSYQTLNLLGNKKGEQSKIVKIYNGFHDIGDPSTLVKNLNNLSIQKLFGEKNPTGLYTYDVLDRLTTQPDYFSGSIVSDKFNVTNVFVESDIYFTMLPRRISI